MTTQFNHVQSIGKKDRLSGLEDNLKSFLDWSFLQIGGFVNVNIPTSGISATKGTGFHIMKNVNEPSKPSKTWEAPRKDWVYENSPSLNNPASISYNPYGSVASGLNTSPIAFSGVYLNNTFLPAPSGSGNYTYSVNYPLGHITFQNNVASTSNVTVSYSHRYIQVYKASDSVWWKEIQKETYTPQMKTNGDYSITSNHRAQLPCIIVELIPRTEMIPYQLGTTENIVIQDVFLHIFAHTANQRNSIIDTLLLQKDNSFWLYDVSAVVKNNAYSLSRNGSINPGGQNYNTLSSNFKDHWSTIKNATLSELNNMSASLYNGIVRWSVEIFP
jgi:hypothetical protein